MNKFWADDACQLFNSIRLIPSSSGDLGSNLNALTRLTIIISVVIIIFWSPIHGLVILIVCLIGLTGTYYASSKQHHAVTENFDPILRDPPVLSSRDDKGEFTFKNERKVFCNDFKPLVFDDTYLSVNQQLAGCANPKTYVKPIISAPSHELDEWRATDLVRHSAINDTTNFDAFRSGYEGDNYTGSCDMNYRGYGAAQYQLPQKCPECAYVPCMCSVKDKSTSDRVNDVLTQTIQPGVYQRSMMDEPINSNIGISWTQQFNPMLINDNCSFVKYTALDGNIPVNRYGTGNSGDDGTASPSNDRPYYEPPSPKYPPGHQHLLGWQSPLDDDNYRNFYLEQNTDTYPHTTGFHPSTYDNKRNCLTLDKLLKNEKKYTGNERENYQSESNIFDPRFTGYGSDDRGYVDNITGQPRFFYSDLDSIKMPNFVARSNVDIFPWATQYGPDAGVQTGDGYKQMGNNAFLDASIKFRTELQERLLRKRNAELWQRRVAPIRTF